MFASRTVENGNALTDRLRNLSNRTDQAAAPATKPPGTPATPPAPDAPPAAAKPPAPKQPAAIPPHAAPHAAPAAPAAAPPAANPAVAMRSASIIEAVPRVYPLAIQRIDTEVAAKLEREELARQLTEVVSEIILELKLQLNQAEQKQLVTLLLDDMLGLGPIEPLLADETVTDIMVNGPKESWPARPADGGAVKPKWR